MIYVFFGNEQRRREFVREHGHADKDVLLASHCARRGSLLGRQDRVEIVGSGDPGLPTSEYLHLLDRIDVMNTLYKEPA